MLQRTLITLFLVSAVEPASAQRLTPGFATSAAPSPAVQSTQWLPQQRARLAPTYWLEGAVIGAVGLGVLGAELSSGMCESDCGGSEVSGLVLGAGLGFTVGALIGGQIHKHPTPEPAQVP